MMQTKIMYIELKTNGLTGQGRICRVSISKTGYTLYYEDRILKPVQGAPLRANYYDTKTDESFWISKPRKDGCDSLFAGKVEIDENARSEYWKSFRNKPANVSKTYYQSSGKSKAEREKIEKGLRRKQPDTGRMPE